MNLDLQIERGFLGVVEKFGPHHGAFVGLRDHCDQEVQQPNREENDLEYPEYPNEVNNVLGAGVAIIFHLCPVFVGGRHQVPDRDSEFLYLESSPARETIVIEFNSAGQLRAKYFVHEAKVDNK